MILYHGSSSANRSSIMARGLLRSLSEAAVVSHEYGVEAEGGVFFSTLPGNIDLRAESFIDIWAVNVDGIKLERDTTTDHEDADPWWVSWYADIEPSRLTLFHAGKEAK